MNPRGFKVGDEVQITYYSLSSYAKRGRVLSIRAHRVQVGYPGETTWWWYDEASLELVNGLDIMLEVL